MALKQMGAMCIILAITTSKVVCSLAAVYTTARPSAKTED
jgi:hypothetical protein